MGLFDFLKKQDCEICGKEVGLLGYKKLEDGEICKDCVKKLPPGLRIVAILPLLRSRSSWLTAQPTKKSWQVSASLK